jgi:hypothetical protein
MNRPTKAIDTDHWNDEDQDDLAGPEPDEADELYMRVKDLVRTYGTDEIRGICDALDTEAAENDY